MIISSFSNEILLKLFVSLMTTPLNCLSEIKVLEPAPSTNIFSSLGIFFRNLINSFKLSAL